VRVYREGISIDSTIECLKLSSTPYYIVDPGETKDSCILSFFEPKFMLVASPNERHWGGSKFTRCKAEFVRSSNLFPVWDLGGNSHGSEEKVVDG
jgi:hypothetical protein